MNRPLAAFVAAAVIITGAVATGIGVSKSQPPFKACQALLEHYPENVGGDHARKVDPGLYEILNPDCTTQTTHGPDEHSKLQETPEETAGTSSTDTATLQAAGKPVCATDNAFEALYLIPSGNVDNYTANSPTWRNTMLQADGKLNLEAQNKMGSTAQSHYKMVCNADGTVKVTKVLMTAANNATFSTITTELRNKGFNSSARKYWVFWAGTTSSGFSGQANVNTDSSDSSGNSHMFGNMFAINYNTFSWSTAMHESFHNLGAVQDDAPDSSGGKHCDGDKATGGVMCYNDGGASWDNIQACGDPPVGTAQNTNLDWCDNDFWAPNHRSDSTYIGTHWNIAECATGPSGGKWLVATWCGWVPPGPADTTAPTTSVTAPTGGSTVSGTVNVTANASDNVGVSKVEFYLDGALKSTDTTSPYAWSWDTTTASNASHTLSTKAYDAANNVGTSANVSVTVSNAAPPPSNIAVYDSTLGAPKCSTSLTLCDSGAALLKGKDTLTGGNEPNQPNTVDTCTDGTTTDAGYGVDESIESIKVATSDATTLAEGKSVLVTVKAYVYSTVDDRLDIYYTGSASTPSWQYVTTLTPVGTGLQTLTATYTLPTGATQALRVDERWQGSVSSCSISNYDDVDDLAFAVSTGTPPPTDTTPPTTSVTAPANGATVSGTAVNVAASASDNVGVSKVEFYIDGVLKSTDTTSPYAFTWDTTAYSNASHTIQSKAYDAANNVGSSTTISVTVSNTVSGAQCSDGVDNDGDGKVDAGDNGCLEDPDGNGSYVYDAANNSEATHIGQWATNTAPPGFPVCDSTGPFQVSEHTADDPTICHVDRDGVI